jgi:NADH:ubiquinone oxidoreductase subunit 6 (subunit J)
MLTNHLLFAFCLLALICSVMVIVSKNPIHSILYLILVFCNVTFVLIILGVEFIAITFLIVYVGAIAVLFLFVVMMLNIKILELDEVFWRYIPVGLAISSIFLFQLFFLVFNFGIGEVFTMLFSNDLMFIKKILFVSKPVLFELPNTYVNGVFCFFDKDNALSHWSNVLSDLYSSTSNSVFYALYVPASPNTSNLSLVNEITNTELLGWLVYTYTFFIFLVISLILLVAMVGSIILVLNQNINVKRQLIFRQTLRNLKSSVSLKT